MLHFKEFPPVPGKIEFAGVDFQALAEDEKPEQAFHELGKLTGHTLLANMQPPSPARVFEAAYILVDDNRKDYFADRDGETTANHFLYGVVDAVLSNNERSDT